MHKYYFCIKHRGILRSNTQRLFRNIHCSHLAPCQGKADGYASATCTDIQNLGSTSFFGTLGKFQNLVDKKFRFRTRYQHTAAHPKPMAAEMGKAQNILDRFVFKQSGCDFLQPNLVFFRNLAIFAKQYVGMCQTETLFHHKTIESIAFGCAIMLFEFF